MAFRFQKRIRIFPGVYLNLSKSGVSFSLGGHGATVNMGADGRRRVTFGIPGTGMSYQLPLSGTIFLALLAVAAIIGLATFATGLWIFDGSRATWIVIGGALCLAPTLAALIAWFFVRTTVKAAPALLRDVRTVLDDSRSTANVLINYESEVLPVLTRLSQPSAARSTTAVRSLSLFLH